MKKPSPQTKLDSNFLISVSLTFSATKLIPILLTSITKALKESSPESISSGFEALKEAFSKPWEKFKTELKLETIGWSTRIRRMSFIWMWLSKAMKLSGDLGSSKTLRIGALFGLFIFFYFFTLLHYALAVSFFKFKICLVAEKVKELIVFILHCLLFLNLVYVIEPFGYSWFDWVEVASFGFFFFWCWFSVRK